jgi:RimJ/RimL family protein N-acetyltransferase
MYKEIKTNRLQLISGEEELLDAAIKGNVALERLLKVRIPELWSEFGTGVLRHARAMIQADETANNWWTYFPIHLQDQILIGTCGYKGPPSDGSVEIGYEIIEAYRGKGLATEMAKGLIENAFKDQSVRQILAHTLAEENASCSVLKKCGFIKTGEIEDEEDGLIWRWELNK